MRNRLVLSALYLLAFALFALSHIYGGPEIWFLFVAAALFAFYETVVLFAVRRQFSVTRELSSERIGAGEDVTVTLQVGLRQANWTPIPWLRIEDDLDHRLTARLDRPAQTAYPWNRESVSVQYVLKGLPRGAYRLTRTFIAGGDVFGLIVRRTAAHAQSQLIVYPALRRLISLPALQQSRVGHLVGMTNASDEATRIVGARDYVPGDRLSRIHWPATARAGALRSKEFERYEMGELVFALDGSRSGFGQDLPSFELALSTVASLAEYAHREGIPFGLHIFGEQVLELPVRRNDLTLVRTLDYLAMAEPRGIEPFAKAVLRLVALPRQTKVLLVTRAIDEGLVRFAVIARDRALRVELYLVRIQIDKLSAEENVCSGKLAAFGWQIRMVHSLDELAASGRVGHAYRA